MKSPKPPIQTARFLGSNLKERGRPSYFSSFSTKTGKPGFPKDEGCKGLPQTDASCCDLRGPPFETTLWSFEDHSHESKAKESFAEATVAVGQSAPPQRGVIVAVGLP